MPHSPMQHALARLIPSTPEQADRLISQLLSESAPLLDQVRMMRRGPDVLRAAVPVVILSALKAQGVLVNEVLRRAARLHADPLPGATADLHVTLQGRVYAEDDRVFVTGVISTITPACALKPGDRLTLHVWEEQDGVYVSCHTTGRYLITVTP